ncbi:MAG: hypothetical protein J6V15_06230, partial [Clostridia bacterium]|nr:hypothetical protein [Clostridia bacterium]
MPYFDENERLEQLESIRLRLMTPLLELKNALGGTQKGERFVTEFMAHIERMGLRRRIGERIGALNKRGSVQQAQEYAQLYDILTEALDQFRAVCCDLD